MQHLILFSSVYFLMLNSIGFGQLNVFNSQTKFNKGLSEKDTENLFTVHAEWFSSEIDVMPVKNYPGSISQNKIEVKIGMDVNRRDLCGFLGYNIPIKKNFEFLPEINFPLLSSISSSIRYNMNLDNNFKIYLQGGIGMSLFFFLERYFEYIYSSGINIRLYKDYQLTIEARIYLIESNNENENISKGNNRMLNIIKYPPTYFTLGLTF